LGLTLNAEEFNSGSSSFVIQAAVISADASAPATSATAATRSIPASAVGY